MLRVKQIEPTEFAAAVAQYSTGSAFSGAIVAYVNAGGWLGTGYVSITGAQPITGIKTFLDSPRVPYFGGTGAVPTALYVTDQDVLISGALVTRITNLSGFTTAQTASLSGFAATTVSGALSAVRVTGSSTVPIVNFSGLGGTLVIWSGNQVFISGAAAGGGGSNTKVTGSSAITTPNFTGVGTAVVTYDGTYVLVSGTAGIDATFSGYVENNFVHRGLATESISGLKTFTGALGVGNPTATGHAVNLGYLTGVSGSLYASITGMTGYNVYNTFNITGTGSITNNLSATGNMTNVFNNYSGTIINGNTTSIGTITGNFVDISFFSDPVATGLNVFEAHVAHSFYFTGAAFACRTTGFGPVNGGIMSGKLYQVDSNNTEQTLYQFAFQSGTIYSGSPLFATLVTGRNRVGLTITNSLSGIEKLSVAIFGSSYV